jgi:hypothetical protein
MYYLDELRLHYVLHGIPRTPARCAFSVSYNRFHKAWTNSYRSADDVTITSPIDVYSVTFGATRSEDDNHHHHCDVTFQSVLRHGLQLVHGRRTAGCASLSYNRMISVLFSQLCFLNIVQEHVRSLRKY